MINFERFKRDRRRWRPTRLARLSLGSAGRQALDKNRAPVHDNHEHRDFNRDMHQIPPDRRELIFRVRRQIAEGTYDTPAKFEIAVERMLVQIGHSWCNDDR